MIWAGKTVCRSLSFISRSLKCWHLFAVLGISDWAIPQGHFSLACVILFWNWIGFFCIRNFYWVNWYLLFVLFMRLFIVLVLVQIDVWRHLHLSLLMQGISNFSTTFEPLLFVVNRRLDFLSQIDSWCFPLKLKYVLMLRQSVALGWSLVQIKKSFFFASTCLRSSIPLTDLPSLYWFLIIYTNREFRELCSQFLEPCFFTWCEFSLIVFNISQDFKLFLDYDQFTYAKIQLIRKSPLLSLLIQSDLINPYIGKLSWVSLTYPLMPLTLFKVSRACTMTSNFS